MVKVPATVEVVVWFEGVPGDDGPASMPPGEPGAAGALVVPPPVTPPVTGLPELPGVWTPTGPGLPPTRGESGACGATWVASLVLG